MHVAVSTALKNIQDAICYWRTTDGSEMQLPASLQVVCRLGITKQNKKNRKTLSENAVQRSFKTLKGNLRGETVRMSCHIFRHLLERRLFESSACAWRALFFFVELARALISGPGCSLPADAVKGVTGERQSEREARRPQVIRLQRRQNAAA